MKLSIIIPMYNTEKYISQCIESVLAIKGIENEVIVVNDGSTDRSLEILKKYEEGYSHIKVITQENQGASMARNRGIQECSGDYIYFLDSDDWIETESFEEIIKGLEEDYRNNQELDIIVGKEKAYSDFTGYEVLDERIPGELTGKIMSGREFMKKALKNKFWNVRLPIYVYRRKLLTENNIKFPVGRKSNEDEVFSIDVFYHAEKLKITDRIFGYYRARSGSIMSVLNIRHSEDIFENVKELIEKYKDEENTETRNMIFYMIKRYYKNSMKKAIQCDRKDVFDKIYRQFKDDCRKYLFRTEYRKFENLELYIIYFTGSLVFSSGKKIKEIMKRKKQEG